MHTEDAKFVNAKNLKLGRFVELGGNDYEINSLTINGEGRVIVVLLPVDAKKLNFRAQRKLELRLIVPKKTPFLVLK